MLVFVAQSPLSRWGRGGSSRVGLLIAVALLLRSTGSRRRALRCTGSRAHGLQGARAPGAQAPGRPGSGAELQGAQAPAVAAQPGLGAGSVTGTHRLGCSEACGVLPEQESSLCLPLWQVASLLLSHQGSPVAGYLNRSYVEGQAPETGNGKLLSVLPWKIPRTDEPGRLQSIV